MRPIRVRATAAFILKNFAAPIAFYAVFQEIGVKPAIAFAVGVAILQVLAHLICGWRFTIFFGLATAFTVLFGSMDLLIAVPKYFRLEAFVQNFVIGSLFLLTLWTRHSMVWRLAMSLPEGFRLNFRKVSDRYLSNLTRVWAFYFFVKAFVFLYLAFQVDLGKLYIYRVILGNGSALLLLIGEVVYRRLKTSSVGSSSKK